MENPRYNLRLVGTGVDINECAVYLILCRFLTNLAANYTGSMFLDIGCVDICRNLLSSSNDDVKEQCVSANLSNICCES